MRPGVRLGIDVGRARVGVASCDPHAMLATPVATLQRGVGTIGELRALVAEYAPVELVVGLPLSLSGGDTASTQDAREFAAALTALGVEVRLVDERMSTVSAQRAMRESGRPARRQRSVVDQVAAVMILQNAIDAERSTGRAPGVRVDQAAGPADEPAPEGI